HIQWSVKETRRMRDWSGKASISQGKIVEVVKDSGPADTVNEDGSWVIVHGRALADNPDARPRRKGLWLTVNAPPDAVVRVSTKSGEFEFRVDEVGARGIERLDGDVKITRAPAGARRARAARQRTPITEIPGALAGTISAERVTRPDMQSDWPAIAHTRDGALWIAYVQWNGRDADAVMVRRRSPDGELGDPILLDDGCWDHYSPAIAPRGNDVLVVWSGQRDGNFELYASQVSQDGQASPVTQLTRAPYADFNVRAASDDAGNVTIAWQSLRSGRGDIFARRLSGKRWGKEVRVSKSPASDWEPSIAIDSTGAAWIAWDTYDAGNYDVRLRRFRRGKCGRLVRVTTEPTAQFHTSVAVDRQDRVWVAWDDGGINWGKDFSRVSRAPGSNGLHASRSIGVRVYANRRVQEPQAALQDVMVGPLSQFAELPELAFDQAGVLWLVFRHWTIRKPTEIYHVYATRLTDEGWSKPWLLGDSSGRNTQHSSISMASDGSLTVAYASDGRALDNLPKDPVKSLPFAVYLARLPVGGSLDARLNDVDLPAPGKAEPARKRHVLDVGGVKYSLLFGDCHRHTDIRGHGGVDGSILDTYRYARDAARLDFMGNGDHNQVTGGTWPDGLRDYSWWWTQKAADLMQCPPYFVGLYSYEHSLSRPSGHRNIIFLKRGAPMRLADRSKGSPDNLPPNLWKWLEREALTQRGQKCVVVPHTFAAGPLADWNWPNAPFDCLLEMYQGCRGSYEAWNLPEGEKRGPTQTKEPGHFAQDALAKGNVYGFVSFSDHGSTHNSWAAVWATECSREALIDAMLARRTYAASDEIILDVTADGRPVGARFEAAEAPTIRVQVKAPDQLLRADVVKNGQYVFTTELSGTRCSFEYRDNEAQPGDAYYYVRVFQRDPEAPEGDPEIAWASPFFVTYK
ncbi:MAG: DUF3604 domain-containing protein, partial [Armatimonadota bacterium]